jgi:SAM-dependent methyltransferase
MNVEQILETYDAAYAARYDETFLAGVEFPGKTAVEIDVLRELLAEKPATRWLDIACGTGFYLEKFPSTTRTGLDISPAMLEVARRRNPDVSLILGNYRDRSLLPAGQWDVVSSMWWAYAFAESLGQIETLLDNIHYWLAEDGVCFMPICSPSHNCYSDPSRVPYVASENVRPYGGRLLVTAVTWSWIETDGKRHDNLLAPQPEYMLELFSRRFRSVVIAEYMDGAHRAILAGKNERQFDRVFAAVTALKNPKLPPTSDAGGSA